MESDFNHTSLEYQSRIAPKKGNSALNLFSFKTEGKGLLGKTFSAAAGGSGEDTQTPSGETADPGDPEGQNWDTSCTDPWWFLQPPHRLRASPRHIKTSHYTGKEVPSLETVLCPLSSFIPLLPNYGHFVRTPMTSLNRPLIIQRLLMAFQELLKFLCYWLFISNEAALLQIWPKSGGLQLTRQ